MNGVQVANNLRQRVRAVCERHPAPDEMRREADSACLVDHRECTLPAMGCALMMQVWCRWRRTCGSVFWSSATATWRVSTQRVNP